MSLAEVDEETVLKSRLLALQRQKLGLVKTHGLAFYRPWAKQDSFHRSTAKHRMVRAGNRSGKSTMGCAEDCAWFLGERAWYPKDDPARTAGLPQRPTKGLVITTDWDKVKEIWTGEEGDRPGKIWQFLPRDLKYKKLRNHSGAIETIIAPNGSIMRFDTVESFKKNPQGSESSDWDWVHVDEPCPEAMYKAAARGLMDRDGSSWFTLTPLTEFWINDKFFPRVGGTDKAPNVWSITASTYENPYLSREAISEFEATLTEDERQCRINGIPLELSGLVYKQFSYDRHVLKAVPKGWVDYNTPPANYIIYLNIDPHPQTPHAVLFVAVAPTGQKFIFRELWIPERPIANLASQILRVTNGYEVSRAECDPIAWVQHPVTELCMADELIAHGLVVHRASKDKQYGILHMQGELAKPDNIYVSPNLNRFLFEINRYCYDKENKPIDKDDHMMECMYRTFINDTPFYDRNTALVSVEDEAFTRRDLDLAAIDIEE